MSEMQKLSLDALARQELKRAANTESGRSAETIVGGHQKVLRLTVMAMMKGSQVRFQIGDNVREGRHVGTVTDVGTVLIQVKTTDGCLRVVCPWELVKTRGG